MLESEFKRKFKNMLEQSYPGCVLVDINPEQFRSFPDLLFLYDKFWATFEMKRTVGSAVRPNQPYWVEKLDNMSFSRFVEPGTAKEVLDDLARAIQSGR